MAREKRTAALLLVGTSVLWGPAFVSVPKSLRPPVLVLPGFANDAQDYKDGELAASGGPAVTPDGGLAGRLRRRGFEKVEVLPVARADWLRVAGALFNDDFRAGRAPPETAFGWYLDRLDEWVDKVAQSTGQRVLLMGHSAGGWLARAGLGRKDQALATRTRALVSLGAPHRAPPTEPPGDDQTKGALTYVDANYPGAFLQRQGVEYVTVAGSAVIGDSSAERGTPEREAAISYERLVGRGEVVGDGIVALGSAHLEGATQVTLPGVRHSIGTPTQWYGAEEVIDRWLPEVTLALARQEVAGMFRGIASLPLQETEAVATSIG